MDKTESYLPAPDSNELLKMMEIAFPGVKCDFYVFQNQSEIRNSSKLINEFIDSGQTSTITEINQKRFLLRKVNSNKVAAFGVICIELNRSHLDPRIEEYSSLMAVHLASQIEHSLRLHHNYSKENILEKISDHVPGVIYQYRLNPDGSSCFPYASPKIRDIYGVEPEEVIDDATKVFKVLHPDDLSEVARSIEESAQTLCDWSHEYRVIKNDGTIRWLFGHSSPERLHDGSVLWNFYITDISDKNASHNAIYMI